MPDQFTENEIHRINDCKERTLREHDNHVRKYGTEVALRGLRKALDEVLEYRHTEAVGRQFWDEAKR